MLTRRTFLTYASVLLLAACGSKSGKKQTKIAAGSTVLALGDSLTYGYGADPDESYPAQLQKLTALAEAQGRPLDLNAFLQKNESLERTEMTQTNRVIIFDTTMRDGEQSPGASMTKEEKIRIARQLEKMGVDVIEAGFAAASPGDFESVMRLPKSLPNLQFAHWHVPLKTMCAKQAKLFPPLRINVFTLLSLPARSTWSTN